LESHSPAGSRPRRKITAAAVTGPAIGPRPASSIPQVWCMLPAV